MRDEERIARALEAKFRERGVDATASGKGVHWVVTCEGATRRAFVNCFWYGAMSGLMIGMNPSNARSTEQLPRALPYEGPEYLVGIGAKDGRTRDEEQAIAAVCAWLEGFSGDAIAARTPFIDAAPRALRAITSTLDPRLKIDPHGSSFIDEGDRSCEVGRFGARFLYGEQQVAIARSGADFRKLTRLWLLDRVSIHDILQEDDVVGDRHAELLEIDPACWHWAHVRDRIDDPDDVLAPLRELVLAFASSPIASRFFSFSSLSSFCFSASSHYPWVREGLPSIWPAPDGYAIGGVVRDRAATLAHVESILAAHPIVPFFGNDVDHRLPALKVRLEQRGLVPAVAQKRGYRTLVVRDGDREFAVPNGKSIDEAVAAVLAFFAS
jgi:hypothetical protein